MLILGGTSFAGRHLAALALERGHELTLFNRGRTGPELFPETERITGDRAGNLERLRGRSFDAVVDTSGYFPADVERSARLLAPAADSYLFISSRSVYADHSVPGIDEDRGPGRAAAGRTDRRDHRRELRPAQGRLRTRRRRGVRRTVGHPAAGADRRAVRPHRPVHVLAAARGRGRRRARAGAARAGRAADRRPRSGGVRARPGRAGRRRAPSTSSRLRACSRSAGCSTPAGRRREATPRSSGWTSASCSTARSSRGQSCRCGRPETTSRASSAPTPRVPSPPASPCGRSPRRQRTRSRWAAAAAPDPGAAMTREREVELLAEWHAGG